MKTFGIIFFLLSSVVVHAQQAPIPLYEKGKVPNAIAPTALNDTIHTQSWFTGQDTLVIRPKNIMPTLTVFQPAADKATGIAVVVCSGGSYRGLADPVEGIPAAQKLAASGITAFLLRYRVPRADLMTHKEIVPVMDAQRAIQYIREHAAEFKIHSNEVGIMGFSAGGHLAATTGTHFNKTYIENPRGTNLRPDFMVLIYPVISFADSLTHTRSRENLIGPDITPEKIHEYSNELQVSDNTPPVFIVHAMDDREVKVANSLYFTAALEQHHIPVKLFLYTNGGHGFGVDNRTATAQWIDPCLIWIKDTAAQTATDTARYSKSK
ncbi:MAG: alpha/beta hydrolase [Chitinophaga sp.]|uniref:alpha/beta hydrolase n=1 Tax=Chitinophaga sp. TaxID=1869181 RepID=UPI0025C4EC29|nr:alpha/beta hydrolase [Chitinophaga sp.]MBV8252110.1 alpha/beta hydrolase [Chitinophaga sp.]